MGIACSWVTDQGKYHASHCESIVFGTTLVSSPGSFVLSAELLRLLSALNGAF